MVKKEFTSLVDNILFGNFLIVKVLTITKTSRKVYHQKKKKKKKKIQIKSDKNSDIFHIFVRRGSNEYPQSMLLTRNEKKMYIPVNPSFTTKIGV